MAAGRRQGRHAVDERIGLIRTDNRHDVQGRVDQAPAFGVNGVKEGGDRAILVEQKTQAGKTVFALPAALVLAHNQDEGAGVGVIEGSALSLDRGEGAGDRRSRRDDGQQQIASRRRVEDVAGIADSRGCEGGSGIAVKKRHGHYGARETAPVSRACQVLGFMRSPPMRAPPTA